MPLEGTTLVREDYHPSTGKSSAQRAGFANAWTIAFLAPVPGLEDDAAAMYADWRRTFVEPELLPGIVAGAPVSETLSPGGMLCSGPNRPPFGRLPARPRK